MVPYFFVEIVINYYGNIRFYDKILCVSYTIYDLRHHKKLGTIRKC